MMGQVVTHAEVWTLIPVSYARLYAKLLSYSYIMVLNLGYWVKTTTFKKYIYIIAKTVKQIFS